MRVFLFSMEVIVSSTNSYTVCIVVLFPESMPAEVKGCLNIIKIILYTIFSNNSDTVGSIDNGL